MPSYEYHHVDVFSETPFEGNPLAVVLVPDALPTATMQRIANEFNLSETVFISTNASEAMPLRLRIFTPQSELAFAGHPTIGAAFVAQREGLVETLQFAFEENVGPVPVSIDEGSAFMAWLTTPPVRFGPRMPAATVAAAIGLTESDVRTDATPQTMGAGAPFLYVPLVDRAAVDRASADDGFAIRAACREAGAGGLYAFAMRATGESARVYARMFGPELGIVEDPATGSATGPLAAYAFEHKLLVPENGLTFVAEQGTKMGRRSLLHVRVTERKMGRRIEVGGSAVHIMEGTIAV